MAHSNDQTTPTTLIGAIEMKIRTRGNSPYELVQRYVATGKWGYNVDLSTLLISMVPVALVGSFVWVMLKSMEVIR